MGNFCAGGRIAGESVWQKKLLTDEESRILQIDNPSFNVTGLKLKKKSSEGTTPYHYRKLPPIEGIMNKQEWSQYLQARKDKCLSFVPNQFIFMCYMETIIQTQYEHTNTNLFSLSDCAKA